MNNEKQNPWCKVFDVESNQVLVRLKLNEENDMEISLETYINGLFMESSVGGFEKNNTTAKEQFPNVKQKQAENFFAAMKELSE